MNCEQCMERNVPGSWRYCQNGEHGRCPTDTTKELSDRLTFLEEHDEPADRHLRGTIQQLTGRVNYLQGKLNQHLEKQQKGSRL